MEEALSEIWYWVEPIIVILGFILAIIVAYRTDIFHKLSSNLSRQEQNYLKERNQAKIIVKLIPEHDPKGYYNCTITIKNIGAHTANDVNYDLKFYTDSTKGNLKPRSDSNTIDAIHSDEEKILAKWTVAKKDEANNHFMVSLKYKDQVDSQLIKENICKTLVYKNSTWSESKMTPEQEQVVSSKFE